MVNNQNLKIVSLNVNGIIDRHRRETIFTLLATKNAEIFLLSDTRLGTEHIEEAKISWINDYQGTDAFFSPAASSRVTGVAILFGKNFHSTTQTINKVSLFSEPFKGRCLSLELKFGKRKHKIISIYAPTVAADRKKFFKQLYKEQSSHIHTIIGGDFNMIQNPNLDKSTSDIYEHLQGNNELNLFLTQHKLVDAFRHQFPTEKKFTFTSRNNPNLPIQSRIDRIYLPPSASNFDTKIEGPYIITDHCMVVTKFSPQRNHPLNKRGKSYWKFDATLLKNIDYIREIRSICDDFLERRVEFSSTIEFWEALKKHFKIFTTEFALDLKQSDQAFIEEKYRALEAEQNKTIPDQAMVMEIQNAIAEHLSLELEKLLVKTKLQKIEHDEKPTAYFYKRLQSRAEKQCIEKVIDGNGDMTTESSKILEECANFYQKLYHSDPSKISMDLQNKMLEKLTRQISANTKSRLENEISVEELALALKNMPDGKSPGSDGLNAEFYKKFQDKLLPILADVAIESKNIGQMTDTQRGAILALLYKNKGVKEDLNNWRPISLLCVDYKIITKSLANRIQAAMSEIIDQSQTACIRNRSINNNLWLLRDVIMHANETQSSTIMFSLDQYKAFDMVDHKLILRTLEKFGFGPNFITWVKTLYTNCFSIIQNNGNFSRKVILERGVRQGCSLSCYLYVVVAEILAITIRKDTRIKGYVMPNPVSILEQLKISQYADDTLIFLKYYLGSNNIGQTQDSLERLMTALNDFQRASGAVLNIGKSKIRIFGANGITKPPNGTYTNLTATSEFSRNFKHLLTSGNETLEIKPMEEGLEVLGLAFYNCFEKTWKVNFEKIKDKIEKKLQALYMRNLTFKGRALVLNTLVLSKLWYAASVFPVSTRSLGNLVFDTDTLITKIEDSCAQYIWQKKESKPISKDVLSLPIKLGGLGILNIRRQAMALKFKQLGQVINQSHKHPSSRFARHWLHVLNNPNPNILPFLPYTEFLRDCQPDANQVVSPVAHHVVENLICIAREIEDMLTSPNQIPTCKQVYNHLAQHRITSIEGKNLWLMSTGIEPKFQNTWKTFASTIMNQNFWKMRLFALHEAGLYDKRRVSRGSPPNAEFCKTCIRNHPPVEIRDSTEHTFMECPKARAIWHTVIPTLNKTKKFQNKPANSIKEVILGSIGRNASIPNTLIATTISIIWDKRNKLLYENIDVPISAMLIVIKTAFKNAILNHYKIAQNNGQRDVEKFIEANNNTGIFEVDQNQQIVWKL